MFYNPVYIFITIVKMMSERYIYISIYYNQTSWKLQYLYLVKQSKTG